MTTKVLLSSQNIANYLIEYNFCSYAQKDNLILESIPVETKNFNLLVTLPNQQKILIKQERYQPQENILSEFENEWKVRNFWQNSLNYNNIPTVLPKILHFDQDNSIVILTYLSDYSDLEVFYQKHQDFALEIADAMGTNIATIHRETFNSLTCQEFLTQQSKSARIKPAFSSLSSLKEISPEIFGTFPVEGFKFIALYQRDDNLGLAIARLENAYRACCLTHNDLRLCNILIHLDGEEQNSSNIVKFIDWERSGWGDPAQELGILIGSYLKLWLNSLIVSKALSIEESLRLATIPLEVLQPSIAQLIKAYLQTFPTIVEFYSDFLKQVVALSGVALMSEILSSIKYQKAFGNTGICMFQVAKSLICRPEISLPSILGMSPSDLT